MRNDLNVGLQAAQAAHAVAQFMIEKPGKWNNEYLILLTCSPLELSLIKDVRFHEPDLKNQLTAVAIIGEKNQFRQYRLLGKS